MVEAEWVGGPHDGEVWRIQVGMQAVTIPEPTRELPFTRTCFVVLGQDGRRRILYDSGRHIT